MELKGDCSLHSLKGAENGECLTSVPGHPILHCPGTTHGVQLSCLHSYIYTNPPTHPTICFPLPLHSHLLLRHLQTTAVLFRKSSIHASTLTHPSTNTHSSIPHTHGERRLVLWSTSSYPNCLQQSTMPSTSIQTCTSKGLTMTTPTTL